MILVSGREIGYENLTKPHIQKAVQEVQEEHRKRTGDTLEKIDADIQDLYIRARAAGQLAVAAKCLEMRGRRKAAFVDKMQSEPPNYVDILIGAQSLINECN